MPIRPIDPAKRGSRSNAASPVVQPAAPDPAPGHQPQSTPALPDASLDTIIVRQRSRRLASATAVPGAVDTVLSTAAKRAHHVVDRTGPNWQGGEYLVGRGRPPKATQWQKGQSGNPRGPKSRENVDPETAFEREVLADFTARVNGEEVSINMGVFALQLLKAAAAKGGVKAQQMLLELFLATVRKSASREGVPEVTAWEQQIIDQMLGGSGLSERPVFRKTDRTVLEEDRS